MTFRFMLFDEPFELGSRKQAQKLTENAAYSIQGGASIVMVCSWQNCNHDSSVPPQI
jgi:hypothetical protein